MNVHIDEHLLAEVTSKTGESREVLLGQIEELAQTHLKKLLGEKEATENTGIDMSAFMSSAQKIASKHEAAFRELAK